jgi:TP901-1 family phage major tail protein
MAAGAGSTFILKQGTAAAGVQVAGMRTTAMTVNNATVDITNKDSAGWRTLLAAAGVTSMSITAAGVFTNATVEETVRGYAFARTINAFGLVFSNAGKLDGLWYISNYQRDGAFNNEETYSLTLESSGAMTYA